MSRSVADFVAERFGHQPRDVALFEAAVTHSSTRDVDYERLEFLGDRVLGLSIARWLYERFPNEPEGKLSQRFNTLVDRATCGEIGRGIGLPDVIRVGKQAREDGASSSDNVVGDVVEAVMGAIFLEAGLETAEQIIRRLWQPLVDEQRSAPKHPKSALQEFAAARSLPNPHYEVVDRSGAQHLPQFTIRVSLPGHGDAEAQGTSKQEAETEAAKALLEKLR
ncbi:ribonuclease III [Sphingomonas sabuli]|uniref:Ribonuclease 3 n=1 Tax=Sphingomonas sabuli TaxID=2764186 RepID=A0A7G9L4U4_9SPHN|nr:ribonuclease III [Sphingomonas sabuli]QNM83643.1 ribonuclease III [Sphingomonas sabuli]